MKNNTRRNQPFSTKEFDEIYSKVPRVTVDLVIRNDKGVLLTLRQKHGWVGQWHLPGGTIYMGERVRDTIHRVAMEELGLKIEVEKFSGYLEYPSEKLERGFGYSIALVFLCHPLEENITLDDQTSEYRFFSEIPENTIDEQKVLLSNLGNI